MTFTSPLGPTSTFPGDTSRWTSPAFCASRSACPTWPIRVLAVSRSTGPARNTLAIDSAGNSSIATNRRSSGSLPQSIMVATRGLETLISCLNSRSARDWVAAEPSTAGFTSLRATSPPVWPSLARHTSPVLPPPIRSMGLKRDAGSSGTDSSLCGPSAVAHVSSGQKFASSGYFDLQIGQIFIRYLR